jgi:LuxR family maltose regulon positive regulatory protein
MLIKTKLQAPSLRSRLLDRGELIGRLSAAKESPLVLVSGPAGSGKSSLICQWISRERLRVAWYSLDEEDNEPDLFFRYLLTTLIQADERLDGAFGPMLGNQRGLNGKDVIPQLVESFSGLSSDIHLILDDFHQIENPEILGSLARLIQYLPDRLHIVMLSRYGLPAAVDIVVIKKETLTIGASNLKFTEQETVALFEKIIPLSFTPDQIRDLHRHVEGWAAGLQLIGVSVRTKGRVADVSNILNQAHDQVANYLVNDILKLQPDKIRTFILATALLDRFNPKLCTEVTGHADAVRILSGLERMNLFLIPLDAKDNDDREWYRFHHMFSEVVRRQVAIETPDLMAVTLRKAAKWFAENNCLEDALRSAFRSDDYEFAANLMEAYISRYIEQHDPIGGIRWIAKLPRGILNQRGLLRLYQCGFLLLLMEHDDVKSIMSDLIKNEAQAFERYSGDRRAYCEDYKTFLNCFMRIFDVGESADASHLLDLRHKLSPKNPILSSEIELILVFIFISKGELVLADASLVKAFELSASYESLWRKIHFAKAKALIAKHRGRLHLAEAVSNQVLHTLNQQGQGHIPIVFLLRRHLGHIYYLQNKLEKAEGYTATALRDNEFIGVLDEIMAGYELRLLIHLAKGEKEQAAERIQRMKDISVKLGMPKVATSAEANAASLAIDQGNLDAAARWARHRSLQIDEPFSLLFAMESLTLARLYHSQGEHLKAAHILETLRKRCLQRTLHDLVLKIDILHSAILHALDQREEARSLLHEALIFSETEGYVRPFVNEAARIAPVLRRIAENLPRHLFTSHLESVLDACAVAFYRPIAPPATEFEHLTQREMEILTWIENGYQNKKIAQKAFISISTVKTHIHSILSKLDAKTRTQAVLKAKELGLFRKISPKYPPKG